jgi:hypothetical protein
MIMGDERLLFQDWFCHRKDQQQALLDKAYTLPRPDEDSPAITNAIAPVADEVDGTYKTLNK